MSAVDGGGALTAVAAVETPRDLMGWTLAWALLVLCVLGVSLLAVDWVRAVRLRFRRPVGTPVYRRWKPPPRRGGLTLRRRPGADVVELHSRERGDVA